jgi:hypothetical protein
VLPLAAPCPDARSHPFGGSQGLQTLTITELGNPLLADTIAIPLTNPGQGK